MFFTCFAFLQVIHCHYQSQASSMPSKEEWFTYDTTVFLHLNNHTHNQRKEMQERKQGDDGHLQHIMASLVIIYNLCFDFFFFFFFDVSHRFVFILRNGTRQLRANKKASENPSPPNGSEPQQVLPPSQYLDCVRNTCKYINSAPCVQPLLT